MDNGAPPQLDMGNGPTTLGAPSLCQRGCGYMVPPGTDKWGREFVFCCQGCASGAGHDSDCLQILGGAGDADIALAMQVEEVHAHRMRVQQHEERQRRERREDSLWDPLWGEVALSPNPLKRYGQQLCFGCCPCVLIGCAGAARSRWLKFLRSFSVLTAILQVIGMVVAVVQYGGHAPFEKNPMLGPAYGIFDSLGAKNASRILHQNEWWRLLSPMLMHLGWLHLLGNLAVQLRTGAMLEEIWGPAAWICIYLLSGVYGALAGCVLMPDHLGVGSSGALCGLLGAWGSFILITWNQTSPVDRKLRNVQSASVAVSIVLVIGVSFMPLVDFAAHVGGLLMGAAVAMVLFGGRLQSRVWSIPTRVCGLLLLLVLWAGGLAWFLVMTEPTI